VSRFIKNKHIIWPIWLAFALVISGCSSPNLDPLHSGSRILAFGDSLTLGVGASKMNSYPAALAELSGLEVINSGISGETTAGGLSRLEQELEQFEPDLLILIEGGNDILQNKRLAAAKSNLAAMIALARDQGIPVVLVGIPEKKLFSNAAPLYEELAIENDLVFDGTLVANLLRNPQYKSDQIHLNEQGYRKMAGGIYELLAENGAL
jgi:acyl-CoA thioesterase-1